MKIAAIIFSLIGASTLSQAALTLSGNSYVENFDDIGNGLSAGWTVNTGASANSLGNAGAFSSAPVTWDTTTGNFRNVASADGLTSTSSTTAQGNSTDRALGIRQTSGFGDPGAAFTLEIANTTGLAVNSLSISLQMLSVQNYSTTWSIQYGLGASPTSFTTLATYPDPGAWGATVFSFNAADLAGLNDQSQEVWFRITALEAATGDHNRDTFAIDDFALGYVAVPETEECGLIAALGLLGICGHRLWRDWRAARTGRLDC